MAESEFLFRCYSEPDSFEAAKAAAQHRGDHKGGMKMWSKIDPVVGVVGTEGWKTEHGSLKKSRAIHLRIGGNP